MIAAYLALSPKLIYCSYYGKKLAGNYFDKSDRGLCNWTEIGNAAFCNFRNYCSPRT